MEQAELNSGSPSGSAAIRLQDGRVHRCPDRDPSVQGSVLAWTALAPTGRLTVWEKQTLGAPR